MRDLRGRADSRMPKLHMEKGQMEQHTEDALRLAVTEGEVFMNGWLDVRHWGGIQNTCSRSVSF